MEIQYKLKTLLCIFIVLIFPGLAVSSGNSIVRTSLEPEQQYFEYSPIQLIGFVRDNEELPSARIIKIQADKNFSRSLIAPGDLIYVRSSGENLLETGEFYDVYRKPKPLEDTETKKMLGFQYYKTGLLRIIESLPDYAVARVEKAFRAITASDILLPHRPLYKMIPLIPGKGGIEGKIFATEEGNAINGDDSIAFINKGTDDGIEIGQTYALYDDYDLETTSAKVDIGSFLVLHTEKTTSTVLITSASRTIQASDKFRINNRKSK